MKSDFDLIIRKFVANDDITIVPISDVHLGSKEHLKKEWKAFCEWVLNTPNVYVTLGGDLINNATRSSVSNVYEEVLRPREQKIAMAELLEPIKDRILCAVSGNHEKRNRDVDDDPVYDIMCKLDLEDLYRENMAFVKIQLGKQNGHGLKNPTYCIAVTHGSGGGTTGSALNRNENFAYVIEGIDALIVGHTHKGALSKPSKIVVDKHNNKITHKNFSVVTSVPWMEYGGYALRGMMKPATFGNPQRIKLCGNKKHIEITW